MIIDVNQPPQIIPPKWSSDADLFKYLQELTLFWWQLWRKSFTDNVESGSGEISPTTNIVFVDGDVELPDIGAATQKVWIKNLSDSDITIETPDSALIENEADAVLPPDFSYTLSPDGSNWWIV